LAKLALLLASAHAAPAAASAWIVDAGRGNGVQFAGVGTALLDRRDIHPEWPLELDRLWIARASYWNAEHPRPFGKHLWDVSLMPTLRLAPRAHGTLQPFVEAAVGAHLLSTTHIDNRPMSTAFQFGEQLALGVKLPGRVPLAISLRGEHVSNGGIKEPNPGVTFLGLRVQLEWR
jgi:hypothetical protein